MTELSKPALLAVIACCVLFIRYLMKKDAKVKEEKDKALLEAIKKLDATISKIDEKLEKTTTHFNEKMDKGEKEFRELDVRMTAQESTCSAHQEERRTNQDRRIHAFPQKIDEAV